MKFDEFEKVCRRPWEKEYDYLCIHRSKKRGHGRYCICNESKNTYIECVRETEYFN